MVEVSRERTKRSNAICLLELKFRGRVNECGQAIRYRCIFSAEMNQLGACPNSLLFSLLRSERRKKVLHVKKLPLAPVGCVQKSRYVWAHRLKSETRLKAFRLLELKICRRMRAGETLRLNDQVPVYLFSRNEAFGTSPKKGAWPS